MGCRGFVRHSKMGRFKNRHCALKSRCPLYPRKRTSLIATWMSAKYQKQTFGMAGEDGIARAALQELRRAQPNVSLAWIAEQMPIKDDSEREHYLEGLPRAGLN
jgi:hypothetical protein